MAVPPPPVANTTPQPPPLPSQVPVSKPSPSSSGCTQQEKHEVDLEEEEMDLEEEQEQDVVQEEEVDNEEEEEEVVQQEEEEENHPHDCWLFTMCKQENTTSPWCGNADRTTVPCANRNQCSKYMHHDCSMQWAVFHHTADAALLDHLDKCVDNRMCNTCCDAWMQRHKEEVEEESHALVSKPSPSSSGCTQQEKEPPSFSVCSFSQITDAEMKVFRCSDCQGGYGRHEELVLCSNCEKYSFHPSCVSQVDRHGELCFVCLQVNRRNTESSPLEDTTSNASGLTGNGLFSEHHLDRVTVAPDGSCWIYAVCAGLGILEHGHVGSQQDKMQYSVAGGWINFA